MRILHKQLLVLLYAATLGGGAHLHAQNDYPAPPKTLEEAGMMFVQMLNTGEDGRVANESATHTNLFSPWKDNPYMGCLSRVQVQSLTVDGAKRLSAWLTEIAPKQRVNTDESDAQQANAFLQGETDTASSPQKPLVIACKPEDGGYRVDLKATYGNCNNLSGLALDKAWSRFTGIAPQRERDHQHRIR